jgi:hypothetical protein
VRTGPLDPADRFVPRDEGLRDLAVVAGVQRHVNASDAGRLEAQHPDVGRNGGSGRSGSSTVVNALSAANLVFSIPDVPFSGGAAPGRERVNHREVF